MEMDFKPASSDANEQEIKLKEALAKSEKALKQANYLNAVIASLSKIYWVIYNLDLKTGTYEKISAGEYSLGITGESGKITDTFGALLRDFVAEPSQKAMIAFADLSTLDERMKGKTVISQEYFATNGHWYECSIIEKERDEQGRLVKALYVAANIDDRKEEQRRIQQERDSQLAIFDALAKSYLNIYLLNKVDLSAEILKLEGYVTTGMDKESKKTFPYALACKQYVGERVHPEDQEMMLDLMSLENVTCQLADKDEYIINYRTFQNEELHYYQAKYVPLVNTDYIIAGFQNIDETIEEQQKQKELMAVALAAAEQSNRAKTTFLNSMSHDIRTPMNAIIGFTALAQTHLDNKELVRDYLGKITTSSSHLLSLINDILDMSRIESGSVKLEEAQIHIPDLLHDLRTIIQGQVASKQQNLYIDTQDVVHEDVITDKLRLNQILLNIVSNAIKFTPVGGNIIIRITEKPSKSKNHTVFEFSVKDTGIGMASEFKEHVFDTFSREQTTTVSGIQGTGLGMAITKNIVDMMGGTIEVDSQEGVGSEFVVTLEFPLADHPVVYEPIEELRGVRALVVDDDVDTCRSVCKMLREIDIKPDWTTSGREAVIRCQDAFELKDPFKVYIIDYLMPDMNGIETVRRIKRIIGEDVPIIILTAYDWSDIEVEAREAGVTAFVAKPIFMSELREVLTSPIEETEDEKAGASRENYEGRRILLVEDNDLNSEIASMILEEAGFIVDTAKDGIEAVDTIYASSADTYDFILMDVQMPRMDGYTATREIRTLRDNKKANIPIIAMTANAFDEDRKKAFEAGMNAHVAKPIDRVDLFSTIDNILNSEMM